MGRQRGIGRGWGGGLSALLAIAFWATGAAAQQACEEPAARVVSLQGTVEFQTQGAGPWQLAALEQPLCTGDVVRVGAVGRAALALANESVLRLDRGTTLRLQKVDRDERSLLDLLAGAINFFARQPRSLTVDTPYLNAAVEGTEFLVRVADGQTRVGVFQGTVRASNDQGELLLAAGDSASASDGEAPRAQIVARPRDAVAWTLYYPPVLAPLADRGGRPTALPPGLQSAVEAVAANDYEGALAALDQVPEGARDARYFVYRAGVLLNVGMVDEAERALARALELDPAAGDALAERAILRVVQNRRDEALADAMRAVELDPASPAAAIALSYALQAQFRLEDARKVLRDAVVSFPEDPLAWARLAELELSFGELDEALEAADRAVALAPGLARTQMVLGFAQLVRIDYQEAEVAFRRAIELDSALPLARLGLGLAIIRGGELDAGRAELEIAAGLDPDDSLLRSYLGKAYFEERRDLLAGEQYAQAKKLDPNDPTPWFYDAIRLQLDNRPVEALRELETAIALNGNRAPYRSRLLLDEDLAVRETSLARIYDDLGFEQRALVEATDSLTLDPANYSAHRFLSDTYAGLPRHEIARASELLQAQLLQPINIDPVQPSAPLTDLNVVAGAGPTTAGLDEFTPLFARNDAQLTATGLAGNNDTLGGETTVSMVSDQMSLSAGGLLSETDGFRDNYDVTNKLANLYGQVAVTPELSVQAEYRRRVTDEGDIVLHFDRDQFDRDLRRDIDQETYRVGARFSPSPQSDVIASVIHTDRKETLHQSVVLGGPFPQGELNARSDADGNQYEGQYLFRQEIYNVTAGFGVYDFDVQDKSTFDFGPGPCPVPFPCESESRNDRKQQAGYVYGNLSFPQPVTWTLGLSYDHFEQGDFDQTKPNPKLGVQWDVTERVRLRAAAFRTAARALVVNQTIEPTQVAGFNQFFDDFAGSDAWRYAVGLDLRPTDALYGGIEASYRDVDARRISSGASRTEDWDEGLIRSYVYWAPLVDWAVTAEYQYDRFKSSGGPTDRPQQVDTHLVPLSVRYFGPLGFFAELGTTFVHQDVDRQSDASLSGGDDSFFLIDVAVGYRLPHRRGIVSLEVANLLDNGFDYEDDNYRTNEDRVSRFIPERTILGRVTLTF